MLRTKIMLRMPTMMMIMVVGGVVVEGVVVVVVKVPGSVDIWRGRRRER